MFDNQDLKALASQATELNRLIQQICRHTDQVRQHQYEERYLDLLAERVGLASRRSQELFDLITSRILSLANWPSSASPIRSIKPVAAPARTSLVVKIPAPEISVSGNPLEE